MVFLQKAKFQVLIGIIISSILMFLLFMTQILYRNYADVVVKNTKVLLEEELSKGDLASLSRKVGRLESFYNAKCFKIYSGNRLFYESNEKNCEEGFFAKKVTFQKMERPDILIEFLFLPQPTFLTIMISLFSVLILFYILVIWLLKLNYVQTILGQKKKLKAIQELSSQIVHDIRNPLSVIELCSEGLEDGDTKELNDMAILRIKEKLLQLLENKKKSQVVDIEEIVRKSILSRQKIFPTLILNLEVKLSGEVKVELNASTMQSIIENMINNSSEAEANSVMISLRSKQGFVEILIKDDGKGVKQNVIDKILSGEKITTKVKGNGIGLTSAVRFCRENLGDLVIRSVEGKGTEVLIKIPAVS